MQARRFIQLCVDIVRSLTIAMLVGAAMTSIFSLGRGHWSWFLPVSGMIAGACIYTCISILQALFRPDRLPGRWHMFGDVATFLVGGLGGWLVGWLIIVWIDTGHFSFNAPIDRVFRMFMLVSVAIAIATGLMLRAFEDMKARIKATAWAEGELELARAIQKRLLPPQTVAGDGYVVRSRNLPAHVVAGDFYDVLPLDDGSAVIVVADVAGKGIGASLTMASVKAVLPFVARETVSVAMSMLNAKLVAELDKRQFVALAYARYFPNDGTLHIANAGMPDPYRVTARGVEALIVAGERLPLGVRRDVAYETLTTTVAPDDRILFFSDGLPEAPVKEGQPLGYDALASIVASMNGTNRDTWLDALLARVRGMTSAALDDDWTAVVLERT